MALINSMSTRGKLTLAACALGFLAAAVFIVKMAGAPSYTTVMTGVDPAKTSQITTALTAAGVPFELQNGGTAVGVQKGKETAANVALASKGLNSGTTQPGFEILDKQKLGASSQQQQIAYQRGLEGTIANTIGQIDGAGGAQVHLTLGQDNLFADESQPATAAVLLPQDASGMDPASVKGIANLVAASVPGLKASSVTITDGSGAMLWPSGGGAGGGGGADGLPSKTAAEAKYNASLGGQPAVDAGPHARPGQGAGRRPLRPQRRQDRRAGPDLRQQDRCARREDDDRVAEGQRQHLGRPLRHGQQPAQLRGQRDGRQRQQQLQEHDGRQDQRRRQDHHQDPEGHGGVNRLDVAVLFDKSVKLQRRPDDGAEGQPRLSRRPADRPAQGHAEHHRGPRVRQGADHGGQGRPDPGRLPRASSRASASASARCCSSSSSRATCASASVASSLDEPSWLRTLEAAQPELMPMPDLPAAAAGRDRRVDRQRRPAAPAARQHHPR